MSCRSIQVWTVPGGARIVDERLDGFHLVAGEATVNPVFLDEGGGGEDEFVGRGPNHHHGVLDVLHQSATAHFDQTAHVLGTRAFHARIHVDRAYGAQQVTREKVTKALLPQLNLLKNLMKW